MKSLKTKQKIGIIGIGTVGRVLAQVIPGVVLYDKYKNIGSFKNINKCDIIFICLPTPYKKKIGQDLSELKDTFSKIEGSKIIVIKSTVLPGTTEKIQNKYPQHKILFNPEFLRQAQAQKDISQPYCQLIGYTKKSKNTARRILEILPKAPFERIIPSREAELVKYFCNSFLATRVIFANQVFDVCKKLKINYELIKECVASDPRIGSSHFEIFQGGYRGYGGKCLPKDVKSFIWWAKKKGIDLKLLKEVEKINRSLKFKN